MYSIVIATYVDLKESKATCLLICLMHLVYINRAENLCHYFQCATIGAPGLV